jgi:uncharacterized protein (DUF1330 family)
MTVYVIAQITIHDRSGYTRYEEGFMAVFEKFDGTMLSIDEEPMVLEGEFTATRSVLITFPSKAQAMAWMTSPDYQAIAKHRLAASIANSILVKGFTPEMLQNSGE